MKQIVNPQLAEEIQLHRKADSLGEKLFRCCLWFFIVTSMIGGIAELLRVDKVIGDNMGVLTWPFVGAYTFSFFYILIYAGLRYTPKRSLPLVWMLIAILAGIVLLAISSLVFPRS